MKNCLYVQWKKPTDASRYVIDGFTCEYSGTEQQNKIMSFLVGISKFKEIYKNKNREDLSPSFRLSSVRTRTSTWFCVEGNFEEVDVAGRKLVYIYATQDSDPHQIVEKLKEYSSLLGVTPNLNDLKEIEKQKKNKKSTKLIILWIITVITICLLSFMLLNHLN